MKPHAATPALALALIAIHITGCITNPEPTTQHPPTLSAAATAAAEKTLRIRAAENGKTFILNDEQTVIFELDGNPTTGYSWNITKVEGNGLQQHGELEYKPAAPGTIGSGGTFYAAFDAKRNPAKTTVTLEYKRPWEKDTPAAKTFKATFDFAPNSK